MARKKKDRFQRDHMARDHMAIELERQSVGTLIGAISMNPGSATYLVAKRKLRKYYKEKEQHLTHPRYEKIITNTNALLPILIPLLLLLLLLVLFILSSN